MKIALVFSGQPRGLLDDKAYNSFVKHILSRYTCDVYAHFWFDKDTGSLGESLAPWVNPDWNRCGTDLPNRFDYLYHPKRVVYERPMPVDPSSVQYTRAAYPRAHHNLKSFYTSIARSIQLIENIHEYDFIIRTRPDALIQEFPDLYGLSNYIYVQTIYPHLAIDNVLWIAKPADAIVLSNMVDNIEKYYSNGTMMNDEEMFYGHISGVNLLYKMRDKQMKVTLARTVA